MCFPGGVAWSRLPDPSPVTPAGAGHSETAACSPLEKGNCWAQERRAERNLPDPRESQVHLLLLLFNWVREVMLDT